MALEPNFLPEPAPGLQRVHSEYRKLTEEWAETFPYEGGACLTSSDFAVMRIALNQKANLEYWKSSDPGIICSVESALERRLKEYSTDLETLLDENTLYKNEFTEKESHCRTIDYAHTTSARIGENLEYCVCKGLFQNVALLDSSEDFLFQDLCVCYLQTNVFMETRVAFNTPGYPHITIISIQPQRASSKKELLYTEVWTLYYWLRKFAQRTLHKAHRILPMRLVSLCGHEARIVSAVFSAAYLRLMTNEPGQVKFRDVKCQIDIADYRDLGIPQHFRELMTELVATPCGSSKM